ncbi:MAG: choice-of-anchor Q domain-containing protein, partial [Candidatus Riflemargulisbacteria bacterium]
MSLLKRLFLCCMFVATVGFPAIQIGATSYATIQAALNSANANDVIVLDAGTYSGAGNVGLVWPNVQNITLQGNTSVNTIIDAQGSARHIVAGYAVTMNISAVSLVNGYDVVIGGSIYISVSDNAFLLNLSNVILASNYAGSGGAIGQEDNSYSKVNMEYCSIYGNSCGYGGGFSNGLNNLSYSSVYNNLADEGGGFNYGMNTLTNSNLYGDSARIGSAFIYGTNKLMNSSVYGNSALSGGSFVNGTNTLINVLVYNKTSSGGVFYRGNNILINSTIVSNTGAIYRDDNALYGQLLAYNTIFVGSFNSGSDSYFNTTTVNYCAFDDATLPTGYWTEVGTISGVTTEDFVDYAGDNYRLSINSEALNAGDNTSWLANSSNITTDITGRADRVIQTTIDIGAYEATLGDIDAPNTVSSFGGDSISTWRVRATVNVTWVDPGDVGSSGVDGFSYEWSLLSITVPDTVKDAEENVLSNLSGAQLSGNSIYFHIRLVDNAGNWGTEAHRGPFFVDVTTPSIVSNLASSTHAVNVWSNDNTID